MDPQPALGELALAATSVAEDLGFVALGDLSQVLTADTEHRMIGGHMVTILVHRWKLGPELFRETGDADLGVPPVAVQDPTLIERLGAIGYQRVAGNRFARRMLDVPVEISGDTEVQRDAAIDILIPSYTTRTRDNRAFGDHLVTTEVPGLANALRRPPVRMALRLRRLNGDVAEVALSFPDEVAALVLKAFATTVREKSTDIVDIWRCLEIAFAAGVQPTEFIRGEEADAASIVRDLFDSRDGTGIESLTSQQGLSEVAADQRFTRIRALITRVIGPGIAGCSRSSSREEVGKR